MLVQESPGQRVQSRPPKLGRNGRHSTRESFGRVPRQLETGGTSPKEPWPSLSPGARLEDGAREHR